MLDFANEADEMRRPSRPSTRPRCSRRRPTRTCLRDPDAPCRLPGVRRRRRGGLREGLLRSQGDAGPAVRSARAGRGALGRCRRRNGTTAAVSSPTMCGCTRSSPGPDLRRRRLESFYVFARRLRRLLPPTARSCRARCSRTSTWIVPDSANRQRQDRAGAPARRADP